MDKLLNMGKEEEVSEPVKMTNEGIKFNDGISNMIGLIDDYLDKDKE